MEDKNSISVSDASSFVVIWQGSQFRRLPSGVIQWHKPTSQGFNCCNINQRLFIQTGFQGIC